MRVNPDAEGAAREGRAFIRLVRSLVDQELDRVVSDPVVRRGVERVLPVSLESGGEAAAPCYPGLVAAAHRLQSSSAAVEDFVAELRVLLDRAEHSDARARRVSMLGWRVDLAPVEPHLVDSARRALAQIPRRPDIEPIAAVVNWPQQHRVAVRESSRLIKTVWPEMFAEMSTLVRQLALLAGPSVNGFTDYTTHGVIYLNRARCEVDRDGLPPRWRLAEALVHEATHTRCNSASLETRFLRADTSDARRISTPLRADPRPLAGLFQQIVVIARGIRFYDLGLEHGADTIEGPGARTAIRSRRAQLCAHGVSGVATARAHEAAFSEAGAQVIDEADAILRRAASAREPASI